MKKETNQLAMAGKMPLLFLFCSIWTKVVDKRSKTIITLLFTIIGLNVWAQDEKIIVWLNDGNKTEVLFADMPEFIYADGNITLQSNNPSTSLSWSIETLQKLTFENVSTAIRDVKTTGLDILSDQMSVYDLNGKMVKKQVKSLSELPKGVYIVKDGSVTIKVVRK